MEKAPAITGGRKEAVGRSIQRLGAALAPKGRTQDVRRDVEKAQDRASER
ncbi:hypothetical protein [Hymenobacter sp. BRD67]|nr:hypothetical protein [Hymenobacter sp. BRD67]QKG55090.1 hypothetical protein GKZ67_21965 [Hymenobacter sp. BRD67]